MRWGQANDLWKKWESVERSGKKASDFFGDISDESLIQLLLTCPEDKGRERDILATEAFNRMLHTRRRLKEVTDLVQETGDRLEKAVERARPAVHATERIAKREKRGEFEMMDAKEAIEVAHEASAQIEHVASLMRETQDAAKRLQEFRDWRMRAARDTTDD